jgi:GNAT superfamily N-acetyltransferase
MFVVEPLSPGAAESYAQFSFPYFRGLLARPGADIVAIGASLAGRPLGLALAQLAGERRAQLHSVAVADGYRRQGVATALLDRLDRELAARDCDVVYAVYLSGEKAGVIEALLSARGWSAPRLRRLVGAADLARSAEVPWIAAARFPPEFSVEAWASVDAAEKSRLAAPAALDPFPTEPVAAEVSLALRCRGELAGWAIWTKCGESRLRCARLFVRPQMQRMARGVVLLARSIQLAHAAGWRDAIFDVAIEDQAMVRFVKRRLAPFLTSLRESRDSFKKLSPPLGRHGRNDTFGHG